LAWNKNSIIPDESAPNVSKNSKVSLAQAHAADLMSGRQSDVWYIPDVDEAAPDKQETNNYCQHYNAVLQFCANLASSSSSTG
jgi:hypothetical protein